MQHTKEKEIKKFKDFTNLYSISRTLRFSLIPILKEDFEGKELTREQKTDLFYERKDKLIEGDRELSEYYKKIKELLNELHQEFIQEAMHGFVFDVKELSELETNYLNLLKEKNDDDYKKKDELRKKLDNSVKKLEQKISKHFEGFESEKYKTKNVVFSKKNLLLGKEVIRLLQEKYKNDNEKCKIIEKFDKFTTYLFGFNNNRDNFYKAEDKAGQFATRAIRDNLLQFLKNKKTFIDKYKDNYKKIGITEEQIKIFELSYFSNLLLQEGIDKYNGVIGNKKGEKNTTNEGINQKINIFAQKQKSLGKDFKKQDYPFFREVYKQIGSIKKDDESKFIEINDDEELLDELKNIPILTKNYVKKTERFYKDFFLNIKDNKYNLDKIYLPKKTGTYLSYLAFTEGAKIASVYRKKNADKLEQEGKDINDQTRSLAEIKKAIEEREDVDISFKQSFKNELKVGSENAKRWEDFLLVIEKNIEKSFVGGIVEIRGDEESKESLSELEEKYNQAIKGFEKITSEERAFSEEEEKDIKAGLKGYLDRILEINRIGQYFNLKKHFDSIEEASIDSEFYNSQKKDSIAYYDLLKDSSELKIYTHYDEIRNYLTGRSKNEEKFKLNFNEAQLLGGWDMNMESTKLSLIFRNNGKYYLGIINKNKDKKIFDKKNHSNIFTKNSNWEKMEFKYFGDVKKQLPRIAFSEKAKGGIEDIGWNLEIQKIKDEFDEFQKEKKGNKERWKDSFNRIKTSKLISYYQQVLQKHSENYKDTYELKWKKPNEYKNIGEFNDEIQRQVYKMNFTNVDESYIREKVENEELYLFQIYNKDFSENKKSDSTDNLETIYFKEVFSDENIKDPLFALGANAEIFFRNKIEKVRQKKKKTGEIDARRFSENKILFHLPIEINFGKGNKKQGQFNKEVNRYIAKILLNKNTINIIGIDRGEKHLLYLSLIDSRGEVKKIETLNTIGGVDYQKKLNEFERERQTNRKSWQPIVGIKNLKKGYISFVVKYIVDVAIESNAIIALEDLNFGFKRGRQKIEKNVYQQFEKALIDKLGFVVDKKEQNQREAPQLSAPFESFEKMGKQTGIVYYVPAQNTSKTCPKCNWQRDIYVHYSGIKNTKENYEKQNLMVFYEKDKDRFRFEYENQDGQISKIYSDVDRLYWDKQSNKGKGENVEFSMKYKKSDGIKNHLRQNGSITDNLKELFGYKFESGNEIKEFDGFGIELDEQNIFKKMVENNSAQGKNNSEKWKTFVFLFNRILEIRNSVNIKNREEDNIICPSCHFDSRKSKIIKDGDANGSYNIAKKGLMVIERISKNSEKPNLYFKNDEYKKFIKDKDIGIKE